MARSVCSFVKTRVKTVDLLSESFVNILGEKKRNPVHLYFFFINDKIEDMNINPSVDIVNVREF